MKTILCATTLLLLICFCDSVALGQPVKTNAVSQNSANTFQSNSSTIDPQSVSDLIQNDKWLNKEVEDNAKSIDRLYTFIIVFFTVIFGVGTLTSIFGFIKAERRADESHGWERSAQGREESIFKQSQQTLTLVNETLGLAKEASARASKSLENKLKKSVKEYEKNSLKLIEESGAFEDDRRLVRQKETMSKIHGLGNKIKGLVNNIVILEDNTVELDPHCYFISGIDSHLREDYTDAIENLENAAAHKEATQKLKSLAYYWLGYINNNLHEFDEAARNFLKALESATGPRKYEIRRINLETRFFNNEDGKELIKEFVSLLADFDGEYQNSSTKGLKDKRVKIQNTLGNVYYQVGNETGDKNYFKLAQEQFETSLKSVNPETPEHMWVSFGLAEAKYKLGETDAAAKILKEQVNSEAEKEFIRREELRTKVLAKTTQLICAVRSGAEIKNIKDSRDAVISVLGDVDNRLTIYSQFQRRNVSKDVFFKEVGAFVDPILKTDAPFAKQS